MGGLIGMTVVQINGLTGQQPAPPPNPCSFTSIGSTYPIYAHNYDYYDANTQTVFDETGFTGCGYLDLSFTHNCDASTD